MQKDLKLAAFVLRVIIGAYWIWSGFVHIMAPKMSASMLYAASINNPEWHLWLIITASVVDLGLGICMVADWFTVWAAFAQMLLIAIYTVIGSMLPFSLWINPTQPAAKNVVIIVATWVLVVLVEYLAKLKPQASQQTE